MYSHYHETIQPVIERETVHQKVIHTTNHIHETEHLNDEHHKATVAPAITMADFEKDAGVKTKASATSAVSDKGKPENQETHVELEIPMSEVKKGQQEGAVHSKKRAAATEKLDVEQGNKAGKSTSHTVQRFS